MCLCVCVCVCVLCLCLCVCCRVLSFIGCGCACSPPPRCSGQTGRGKITKQCCCKRWRMQVPFHTRSPAQVDFSASVQVKFKASNPQVKERKPKQKTNSCYCVQKQTNNQPNKQTNKRKEVNKSRAATRVQQVWLLTVCLSVYRCACCRRRCSCACTAFVHAICWHIGLYNGETGTRVSN